MAWIKGINGMLHSELTEQIIGGAFDVSNELGAGFLEAVYESALAIALEDRGIAVQRQAPIEVYFRRRSVGVFYADLLVEGKVIVELKAVPKTAPQHEAQIINYLAATGFEVGLLINFGNPRLEYRRFNRRRG